MTFFTDIVKLFLTLIINILKNIMKYKKLVILVLFTFSFVVSFYVQFDENYNNKYWDYKVLEKFDFNMNENEKIEFKSALKSLNENDTAGIAKLKQDYNEPIRKFLPSAEQYRDWYCYRRFNTNTDDMSTLIFNSLNVLRLGEVNNECISLESKELLYISYVIAYLAAFFTILLFFVDKIRSSIPFVNHTVFIGLNKYSREIIRDLSDKQSIKIFEKNPNNEYIQELKDKGHTIITGILEYQFSKDILNAKEIFIIENTDSESMNNLALIIDKFNNKQSWFSRLNTCRTKIYIEVKNRENRVFFDKKGLYSLVDKNKKFEIIPFSINELIAQRMFKNRPLVSNLKKDEIEYKENLKVLIVGFNDLTAEILYNILKLGHFGLDKFIEVTVLDDNVDYLNEKYEKLIKNGRKPLKESNETFWDLKFLPFTKFYSDDTFITDESFNFNRIIICHKEYADTMELLNFINNNYYYELMSKDTIIQIYNEHVNINNRIDKDQETFNNFYTFGDIETVVSYDYIVNNRLYEISKATNDFKEYEATNNSKGNKNSKSWNNTDSFTRESNITEKLHMNVKLNIFNLIICDKNITESKNKTEDISKIIQKYYDNNKDILKDNLNEALKLPYATDYLNELIKFSLLLNNKYYKELDSNLKIIKEELKLTKEEENELEGLKNDLKNLENTALCDRKNSYYEDINDIKQKIENINSSRKKDDDTLKKYQDPMNKILKEYENKVKSQSIDFYNDVESQLVLNDHTDNNEKIVIMMTISLVDFYLKVKDNPNHVNLINDLAELEHRRWNAYHILNGWKFGIEKDPVKKEHNNICDWKTLNEKYKNVIKYDYKNVYQIPFVAFSLGYEIKKI